MLFADRLEVWNPGALPPNLSFEELRTKHASIPSNPLIAEPLFWAHYVETLGTGTLDMIDLCQKAGLPEPTFEQRGGTFAIIIWRDWLTDSLIESLTLNDRQQKGLQKLKVAKQITSAEYQELTGTSRQTATRDLYDLVKKKVIVSRGRGRGAHYIVARGMPQK